MASLGIPARLSGESGPQKQAGAGAALASTVEWPQFSPVVGDGRIYLATVPGKLTVVKAGGEKPDILHQANFEERIFATPALVGARLYLRTRTKLYSFGK
ncbi:MAG: hypothetical protein DMG07_10280 [Acidobacteria bacterium]|nr:MAG: hypothetical protein DMG07_10280 [Acidobacteriota bacterium]